MADAASLNSNKLGAAPIDVFSSTYRLLLEGSQEFFPIPTYAETFASSPSTEGGSLVRSRADNVVRQGQVLITGPTRALLLDNVATFEQKLEECRRYSGVLTYLPEGGVKIDYDVVSARVVSADHSTGRLVGGNVPVTFEMTFLPYGRLAPLASVTNATSSDIMLSFNVPPFAGSVDGLGELVITNSIATARNWFEGGLESRFYDPAAAWPLVVDSALMTALESAATDTSLTPAYGASTLRQTLSVPGDDEGIGFYTSSWQGRFRIKARVWSTVATSVALQARWSTRGGSASVGPWVPVPAAAMWRDLDLGIVAFPPPLSGTHSARLDVYAKSLTGAPVVDLDVVKLVPAERYWRASGPVGAVQTIRGNRYVRVRHDALETETANGVWQTHPNAVGSYLTIPPSGGRIAVFAHRNDLLAATPGYTPIADSLRADLTVTPRVALMGA